MALYKIFIDSNNRLVSIPAWANPDERTEGEVGPGFRVINLSQSDFDKAIPFHSTLNNDDTITIDADYVPPVEPSTEPRPDPSSVALAGLSATVAKQGVMIANLTLQIAQLKAGK